MLLALTGGASGVSQEALPGGALRITVRWDEAHQTLHGFGASGAWSTPFVGKHWPAAKKNKIADWLFSRETELEGQPQGIGLSIWRFNAGAVPRYLRKIALSRLEQIP